MMMLTDPDWNQTGHHCAKSQRNELRPCLRKIVRIAKERERGEGVGGMVTIKWQKVLTTFLREGLPISWNDCRNFNSLERRIVR